MKKGSKDQDLLKTYNEDMKRHIGGLVEHFEDRFGVTKDRFDGIDKRFDGIDKRFDGIDKRFDAVEQRLDTHTEMIGKLMEDVQIVKEDVEFLKGGMKKKIDVDEFMALERRVILLERKAVRT